jgi:hypothetical protein
MQCPLLVLRLTNIPLFFDLLSPQHGSVQIVASNSIWRCDGPLVSPWGGGGGGGGGGRYVAMDE